MKKIILIVVLLIIAAIGGGIYYVLTNLDSLVKQAIETYGSQATHTAVRVKSVNIQLKQASASIAGLTVANPSGFSSANAFSLGQVATRLNISKMSKEHIVIDEVLIKAPEVFYEMNAEKKTNLNIIKGNLGGGSAKTPASKTESKTGKQPILTIHKFVFADAALHAMLVPLNNKKYDLKIPSFQLVNLSGTPEQISRQVMNQFIDHARAEIRKKGIDAELDKAKAKAKEKLDTEKAKLKQKADTRLDEEKAKAEDKLRNLISK